VTSNFCCRDQSLQHQLVTRVEVVETRAGISKACPTGAMASAFVSSRPSGNSGPSNASIKQGQQPVDLHALQNASRVLQDQFAKDTQIIPDLGELLAASTRNFYCLLLSY
jgi:diaminopimelate epimerase